MIDQLFEQLHYSENRSIAFMFHMMFGVELPTYTSRWVYPLIYPLLAIIPGTIGALTVMKMLSEERHDEKKGKLTQAMAHSMAFDPEHLKRLQTDLMTWIGIVGANVIVFTHGMQTAAKFALFRDPALERLKYLTPR